MMTTQEIISEIDQLTIDDSDDFDALDRVDELTAKLIMNNDGYLAAAHLIHLLERHPEIEFGTPGEPVHTLERFQGHYEDLLYESLARRPTEVTVWMLNRIINGEHDAVKKIDLLKRLKNCSTHPRANDVAKQAALDFLKYQTED